MVLLLPNFPEFWQHLYHIRFDVTGTFATGMVLLRRGGTKLEKGLTKTSLDPTWTTEAGRHETVRK